MARCLRRLFVVVLVLSSAMTVQGHAPDGGASAAAAAPADPKSNSEQQAAIEPPKADAPPAEKPPAEKPAVEKPPESQTHKWEFGISIRAVGGPCAGLLGTFPVPMDWP